MSWRWRNRLSRSLRYAAPARLSSGAPLRAGSAALVHRPATLLASPGCASGYLPLKSLSRSHTGGFLEAELLDRDLSHLEFLDLARDRHRKRVDELPVPGDLVGGDLALAPRGELLARLCRPLAQLDPGHYLFAVLLVRDPDHLHVHDVRVRVEELFDLAGVDVLAAADEHVLDPAT